MLREEVLRALRNRSFLLGITLTLFSLGYGFADYVGPLRFHTPEYLSRVPPFYYNAYDAFIWAQDLGFLGLIAPLIAAFPFSDSLTLDRVSGFLRLVLARTSYWRYFIAKVVACVLAGGLALALPLLACFVCANFVFPRGLNLSDYEVRFVSHLQPPGRLGPLGALYWTAPDLYAVSLIIHGFVFGAVYALFGLAVSSVNDNRYIALVTPFLVYILAHFVTNVLRIPQWSPLSALAPYWLAEGIGWLQIGASLGAVLMISIGLFLVSAWRMRDR